MAVPATQGKQCKYLEEMEIGDYIRCTYTATAANVAGEFSDLGGFIDTYEIEQKKVDEEGNPMVDADGNPAMETVTKQYEEIPATPGSTANGYFYFLKVDKGLCVADRRVQSDVSLERLNDAGYIHGAFNRYGLVRVLSPAEYKKYVSEGDCNGSIVILDKKVWNWTSNETYINFEVENNTPGVPMKMTKNLLFEITGYTSKENYLPEYNLNRVKYSANAFVRGRAKNTRYSQCTEENVYIEILDSNKGTKTYTAESYYKPSVNRYVYLYLNAIACFRPVLEYIDNPNSKTIYF